MGSERTLSSIVLVSTIPLPPAPIPTQAVVIWEEETSVEVCLRQIGLWRIFLIDVGWGLGGAAHCG